jgi:hypothetical protein
MLFISQVRFTVNIAVCAAAPGEEAAGGGGGGESKTAAGAGGQGGERGRRGERGWLATDMGMVMGGGISQPETRWGGGVHA